jgi:hypothetical protein
LKRDEYALRTTVTNLRDLAGARQQRLATLETLPEDQDRLAALRRQHQQRVRIFVPVAQQVATLRREQPE